MTNLIASTLLIAVMGISGFFGFKIIQFESMSEIERLNDLWLRDIRALKKSKHVHPGWNSIATIEAFGGTKKAKSWLKDLQVPTQKTENGKYKLEVLVLEFEDEGSQSAVIQLNLEEIKSGNMVWEFARTYKLDSYLN